MQTRPRLVAAVVLGIAVAWALPEHAALTAPSRWLIGWNAGAVLYLVLLYCSSCT